MTYREQVVSYILNLMGQASALAPVASANVDPFTGQGAYVPGASNGFPTPGGGGGGASAPHADPFTGEGASPRELCRALSPCSVISEQRRQRTPHIASWCHRTPSGYR